MRLSHISAAIACFSHVAHVATARVISVRNSVVTEAADHLWEQIHALDGSDPLAGATPGSSATLAQYGDASMGVYVMGEANGDATDTSSDSNANAGLASTTQAQPPALMRRGCISAIEPEWSDIDRVLEMIRSKGLNIMVPQMTCKWYTYGTATSEICNNNRCAALYLSTDTWGEWLHSLRFCAWYEHRIGWEVFAGRPEWATGTISMRRTGTENPSPSPPQPVCRQAMYVGVLLEDGNDWWT